MEGKSADQVNKRQLFIRNLAFDTTKEELEQLFQDIGPLKNISVAMDHATGKSKGFGFVKFALEEDADIAMRKLQGHDLHGRRLSLDFGIKKEREPKKRKVEDAVVDPAANTEAGSAPVAASKAVEPVKKTQKSTNGEDVEEGDHVRRSRQVLVCGIPIDVNKKTFKFVLQKISRKPFTVELIKQDHVLSPSLYIINPPGKIMLVTAHSRQEATKIMDALNIGTIHNLNFSKFLNKDDSDDEMEQGEEDDADDDEANDPTAVLRVKNRLKERLMARLLSDLTDVPQRKRKCRLIIRNLSFQATQQNIIDKMKKFGPLVDAELPTSTIEVTLKPGKPRGRDAEAAQGKLLKERMKGFAFVTFLCEKDAQQAVNGAAGLKICNREVAIDFCMSKHTYQKYGQEDADGDEEEGGEDKEDKGGDEAQDEEEAGDDAEEEEEEQEEGEEEEDGEDDADEGSDEGEEDGDAPQEGEEGEDEPKKRRFEGDVNEGKTIFVRGLPFDATPVDVKKALQLFGKIEMALIVTDKQTGVSKGSAFVKFADNQAVEKCLKDTLNGINIKDRMCKLNLAVDKDSADRLRGENKVGKDKRNLYLANEGLVADATQIMSEYDREKRLRAQSEKKKKLVNPLFFVSNNRISVRNIGKTVTDSELRIACTKATKKGLERKLINVQDMKNMFLAQGNATGEISLTVPRFDGKQCVKTAKVMYDVTKSKEGGAQSKGYGFVEFHNHAFALTCLRELNNNPEYHHLALNGSKGGRLIVEFSLENIRKVKILKERQDRQRQRNEENPELAAKEGQQKKPRKREPRKRKRQDKQEEFKKNAANPTSALKSDESGEQAKKKVKIAEENNTFSPAPMDTTNAMTKKGKVSFSKIQNKKHTKQAQAKKRGGPEHQK